MVALVYTVTLWSGPGGIEAYLISQVASLNALTLLVGTSSM